MPKYIPPNSSETPAAIAAPAVSAVHILDDPIITINADDPVVIMTVEFELPKPGRVVIEGVVNGSFYHVCGLAAYVDEAPINKGTGDNLCHVDCFQIMFGNGGNNFMCPIPYKTVTDELPAGPHKVELAVIGKWSGVKRAIYINSRLADDMASTSSLIVREL